MVRAPSTARPPRQDSRSESTTRGLVCAMLRALAISIAVGGASAAGAAENPTPIHVFEGNASLDHLGAAVGAAGDWNGDGHGDIVLGAPGGDFGQITFGYVEVRSGKSGELLASWKGVQSGGGFGTAVAAIGDADQDGFIDLAIGAPHDPSSNVKDVGSVTIISGQSGKTAAMMYGDNAGDALGTAIAAMGDANLDGIDDVLAGAPGYDKAGQDSGAGFLYSGNGTTISTSLTAGADGLRLGTCVARAGYMSPTGVYPDLLIGGPGSSPSVIGTPHGLVVGFTAKGSPFFTLPGEEIDGGFGAAIASDVDLNQDGRPDILIGMPRGDKAGKDAGAVHVVSGEDGKTLASYYGSAAGALFGSSVAILGDVDGDLAPDYLIGAPGIGAVHVISGKTGTTITSFTGEGGFGTSIADVGDVDLDGQSDFGMGTPDASNGGGVKEAGVLLVFGGDADPKPVLAIDDTTPIDVTWIKGSTLPTPVFRTVQNIGADNLSWTATKPAVDGWLTVEPTAGITGEGQGQQVSIFLDPSGLPSGLHQSAITFEDIAAPGSPILVAVQLTVEDSPIPPTLCLDGKASLVFEHQLGAPPPEGEAFTITNCGNLDVALPWTVTTTDGGQGWLLADIASGQLLPGGDPQAVVIRAVVSDVLKSGIHHGSVLFQNLADPGNTVEIPVTLTVALASFTVGDRLVGVVGEVDDEDAAAFFAADGMTLKVTVNGKGSLLKPWLELADESGVVVKHWKLPGSGKKWKKKITFQSSGVFRLRIGGRKESTGPYEIKTSRKLPPTAKIKVWSHLKQISLTGYAQVPVFALPGTLLSANLIPENFPFANLGGALIAPDGQEFDLGSFAVFSSGAMHLVQVPLGKPGEWMVRVSGLVGQGDMATVQVFPVQPGAGGSVIPLDG